MSELTDRIIARLSDDERRTLALPFVQTAMEHGSIGITIDKHHQVPPSTIRSLQARGLASGKIDPKTRIMPLSDFGVHVAEQVRAGA